MSGAKRILALGAASAIAQAYLRLGAAEGAGFILAGRVENRLAAVAADLTARGATAADTLAIDLAAMDGIEAAVQGLTSRFGFPDEVVLAYGVLGDQALAEQDLTAARRNLDTNFTSAVLWLLALLKERPAQAPLTIVAIGSVAGDRGRASNFVYGAAKGGLDRFLEGLAQKYDGSPVRVVTVKPGFVDTPMTAAITKGGPLWATPDQVAADIQRAVAKGKRIVYTPWFWWPIMTIIRHLPWFVFKRLKV
jgi:decaprenylphospho-beta-D-erythro-pentofuranosid-2-ulose 2-reductase